jgi:toxin-antitoxin system PIN domain toxin
MILIDANILLYAYDTSAEQHDRARNWLELKLSSGGLIALSWQSITAFLRISTNPRAYTAPFTLREANRIVAQWLGCPTLVVLTPTPRHWEIFQELLLEGQASGPLVMDAHLAALSIEHGAILCTTDRDFSRFSGLQTFNPLSESWTEEI